MSIELSDLIGTEHSTEVETPLNIDYDKREFSELISESRKSIPSRRNAIDPTIGTGKSCNMIAITEHYNCKEYNRRVYIQINDKLRETGSKSLIESSL